MAAQVRDKDFEFTQGDIDRLSGALKDKEFRKLLSEYCEEIQDPANRALYQCEITELEKQRGVDVTFINPSPGYVIKSSVGGDKKAFINVCTNENIAKPSYSIQQCGQRGIDWQLPFSIAPPHDDLDKKRNRCVVYDVVFHPNTLRMAEKNAQFKNMLDETACDAVESNHNVNLDKSNLKFPKLSYKGVAVAAVVRKPDPDYNPDSKPAEDSTLLDELYPQRSYPSNTAVNVSCTKTNNIVPKKIDSSGYAVPKYVIKQRRDIDIKEFTYEIDAKKHSAIPSSLIIEINLPLLSSSAEAILDVKDKVLSLVSEKPARYKLELTLPYKVDDNAGSAKFDLSKRLLIINLPVIPEKMDIMWRRRDDSGVDSDSNSPCASDEDNSQSHSLVTELSESSSAENDYKSDGYRTSVESSDFLLPDLSYSLPPFTCNVLDNTIAFTLHVKNVDPDSVKSEMLPENNGMKLKFSSIGAGFFPIHHALFLKFPMKFECEKPEIEAWDNNVVMQVEIVNANMPDHYLIGLTENNTEKQLLNVQVTEVIAAAESSEVSSELNQPIVEVSARGNNEMSISLTVADAEDHTTDSNINIIPKRVQENSYDSGLASSNGSYKGILKWRPSRIGRSYSESSVDFMEYSSPAYSLSSADCIPEEESASLKKTVRFSNVIAKQTFRSNSSILGQKSKNQRKKRNKKRAQERRASEGDPEDDGEGEDSTETLHDEVFTKDSSRDCNGNNKMHRRDSGVVDAFDAEVEKDDSAFKAARKAHQKIREVPSFNHKNVGKGKYQEVNFKNDLIFDLDM